jgi:hypothetical protein
MSSITRHEGMYELRLPCSLDTRLEWSLFSGWLEEGKLPIGVQACIVMPHRSSFSRLVVDRADDSFKEFSPPVLTGLEFSLEGVPWKEYEPDIAELPPLTLANYHLNDQLTVMPYQPTDMFYLPDGEENFNEIPLTSESKPLEVVRALVAEQQKEDDFFGIILVHNPLMLGRPECENVMSEYASLFSRAAYETMVAFRSLCENPEDLPPL